MEAVDTMEFQKIITPQRGSALALIGDTRTSSSIEINGSFQKHKSIKKFIWKLASIWEVNGG